MPQIGQFTRDASGFAGQLVTLTMKRDLVIVPAEHSDAENAPDYRVHYIEHDGPEVGAAWKRTGEKAGEYLSVLLDDPALPLPDPRLDTVCVEPPPDPPAEGRGLSARLGRLFGAKP